MAVLKCTKSSTCTKEFKNLSSLKRHEWIHADKSTWPHPCDQCTERFKQPTQLDTHVTAKHNKDTKHNQCICGYSCADSSQMTKHMKKTQNDATTQHGWTKYRGDDRAPRCRRKRTRGDSAQPTDTNPRTPTRPRREPTPPPAVTPEAPIVASGSTLTTPVGQSENMVADGLDGPPTFGHHFAEQYPSLPRDSSFDSGDTYCPPCAATLLTPQYTPCGIHAVSQYGQYGSMPYSQQPGAQQTYQFADMAQPANSMAASYPSQGIDDDAISRWAVTLPELTAQELAGVANATSAATTNVADAPLVTAPPANNMAESYPSQGTQDGVDVFDLPSLEVSPDEIEATAYAMLANASDVAAPAPSTIPTSGIYDVGDSNGEYRSWLDDYTNDQN